MKYAQLPSEKNRMLPFFLAMEEYVATKLNDDLFFTWQVEPTVIFGRNQLVESEVNIEYCKKNNINFFRRKSGGGCVYADKGNVMLSFVVTSDAPVMDSISKYAALTAGALQRFGIPAETSGRNDITVNGRKISGFAAHKLHNRTIVHSTLLYDFDACHMENAIHPSQQKLSSKGVDSVRSHISSLSECGIRVGLDELKNELRRDICADEVYFLTEADEERISQKSLPYYDKEWLFGKNPRSEFIGSKRYDGVGEFQAHIHINGNTITHFVLAGDFFSQADSTLIIEELLLGLPYERKAIDKALDSINIGDLIPGLTKQKFIQLLF